MTKNKLENVVKVIKHFGDILVKHFKSMKELL